jgi:general secretion pathway protein M
MQFAFLDRFGLNARERRLVGFLIVFLGAAVVLGIPILLETVVMGRRTENEELRAALGAVQSARAEVKEKQARKTSIAQRYEHRAPALAGFLEQNARKEKLEVTDSQDRPEQPHGKKYSERSTQIHLKKAGMYPIAKFLESIEKSNMAVAVTRLSVRKRSGEPDSYDVEVAVSAFDRNASTPGATDDKDKGADTKGKP